MSHEDFITVPADGVREDIESLCERDIGRPNATIRFTDSTPAIFQRLGLPDLPVEAYRDKLARGLFLNASEHHGHSDGLTKKIIIGIALNLADPYYVFLSRNGKDLIPVYRITDKKGENVMISLRAKQSANHIDVNLMTSLYGKKKNSLQNWINQGLLLYLDDLNNPAAALNVRLQSPSVVTASKEEALAVRLRLPSGVTSVKRILYKSDLVKSIATQ